ncbi:spermidine/putrescine ABC transporter ATP-binding subunit [Rhodopseudomonas julia]|uniref:Spermidine/putrescine import ATP-binding protein PotA n=1 Tax=Rhodopseudomonas julia TaxID=200617 RepID=A0ABU0CAQ2_9BRAD|nr:ABC transporter ATP-binding protein [Rhodopseudomonas julia]MDQ0327612.1 spermidine/putrescine ABC transporter ATP-binding subunit [Rhodopseudomonas julia]
MTETSGSGHITLEGVGKIYGDTRVVSDVNVTIEEGEFFSLLGPSGSGKTTTLMMIAGFAETDLGRITVGGRDISSVPPKNRGFGMVFQNYALFPHMSVAENVAFPLKVRGVSASERRERVAWALETVKLTDFADRAPRRLSGGQQQRVALARAIVYQPKVILMDEPLGALDKNLRFHMQTEIKDIQRRLGMTVIYVTHDQEEAMNLSDRIAIMRDGRMAQLGSPSEVYQHPVSAFVGTFLGEANLLPVTATSARSASRGGLTLACSESPSGLESGQALLFVRPEKLRVAAMTGGGFDNELAGTVHRVSYLGNIIRYGVTIDGEDLTADVQNLSGEPAFAVGASCVLGFNAADCRLLPVEAPARSGFASEENEA